MRGRGRAQQARRQLRERVRSRAGRRSGGRGHEWVAGGRRRGPATGAGRDEQRRGIGRSVVM